MCGLGAGRGDKRALKKETNLRARDGGRLTRDVSSGWLFCFLIVTLEPFRETERRGKGVNREGQDQDSDSKDQSWSAGIRGTNRSAERLHQHGSASRASGVQPVIWQKVLGSQQPVPEAQVQARWSRTSRACGVPVAVIPVGHVRENWPQWQVLCPRGRGSTAPPTLPTAPVQPHSPTLVIACDNY
jgi:hypothetical protein